METKKNTSKLNYFISIVLSLFIILAVPSTAFAISNTTSNLTETNYNNSNNNNYKYRATNENAHRYMNENKNGIDMRYFKDNYSAKMRLLQLERRLEFQEIEANLVLNYIMNKTNGSVNNFSNITELISSYETLSNVLKNEINSSDNVTQMMTTYTTIKNEAINNTNELRNYFKNYITEEDAKKLKQIVESNRKTFYESSPLTTEIRKLRREHNAYALENLMNTMNLNDKKLIEEYKEGKIGLKELREQIRNSFKKMNKEEKKEIFNRLKEKKIRDKIKEERRLNEMRKKINRERTRLKEDMKKYREMRKRFENRTHHIKINPIRNKPHYFNFTNGSTNQTHKANVENTTVNNMRNNH